MARRFGIALKLQLATCVPDFESLHGTALAQPAIVTCSRAGLEVLAALGIEAAVAVGHSLGELSALHWAGALEGEALGELARVRGQEMMNTPGPEGGMLSIGADPAAVENQLAGTRIVIAGLNLPLQTVVSGERRELELVAMRARKEGWRVDLLPVSHAFHSAMMEPAAPGLRRQLERTVLAPLKRPVASTITGRLLAADADVATLLCRQLTSPVRFAEAVAAMGPLDLVIEVGPGRILTGLADQLLDCPALALDAGGDSLAGLLAVTGAAFALGAEPRISALFEDRFTRPFDLDWNPRFLANPCESAPVATAQAVDPIGGPRSAVPAGERQEAESLESTTQAWIAPAANGGHSPLERDAVGLVQRMVAEFAELPLDAVRPSSRLLNDLHLNSIAVGQIATSAARALGLSPGAAPTEYADATVGELGTALEERVRAGGTAPTKDFGPAGVDDWIRAFVIDHEARPLPAIQPRTKAGAWQVRSAPGHPLRSALEAELAHVSGSGIVVCLSAEPGRDDVALLVEGAHAALEARPRAHFVVVQQRGGGGGFARSFHLESPHGMTCVVEVPLLDARTARWVAREVAAANGYTEARYDESGARSEPVMRLLPIALDRTEAPAGEAPLSPGDVLLVTGGGKGIAMECALAVARECGCRLALLGRSDPANDLELASNLERVRDSGCEFRYLIADVMDATATGAAVAHAEAELGPVTAVLHGAGVNTPELLGALTTAAAERTLDTKVRGAEHVLAAVRPEALKWFIGFGSIISRTGMRGEADYALANERLTLLIESLARRLPSCRCLSIEWSVWSGVGMGERLGRIDVLRSQGVMPLPADEAVEVFLRLLRAPLGTASVVVSGRVGVMPTLAMAAAELPLLRFVEHVRVHVPGVELVADAEISAFSDPYLEEHRFDGSNLLPAVVGLEAMAQAAMAIAGRLSPPRIEDIRFDRPVAVPQAGTTLRIAALVRRPGRVEVSLRCDDSGFHTDHFHCTCLWDDSGSDRAHPSELAAMPLESVMLPIDPAGDLYGRLLFQSGRFRRLAGYHSLQARHCVAEVSPADPLDWFGRYLPARLVLGDPAARDTAIHAIQACIPHARLLPVGADRLWLDDAPDAGPRFAEAIEVAADGRVLVYDLVIRDSSGRVRERWDRLRLAIVDAARLPDPCPAPLLATYVERRVREILPHADITLAWIESATPGRHARSDEAIGQTLRRPVTVRRRPDGKPMVEGACVSAAHCGPWTLAVSGAAPLGCDLELASPRSDSEWGDLLGVEAWGLAAHLARAVGESIHISATRVWSALECLKKAGISAGGLRIGCVLPDGWAVLETGRGSAVTFATNVRGSEVPLVLAIHTSTGSPACAHTSTGTSSVSKKPISSATSTS